MARLAGLKHAGVICEIMNDDGTMSRMPELKKFAKEHGIKVCTIADLVAYRLKHESLVRRAAEVRLPSQLGEFSAIAFENDIDKLEHLALVKGRFAVTSRCWSVSTPNALPEMSSPASVAIVPNSCIVPWKWSKLKGKGLSFTCARKGVASA